MSVDKFVGPSMDNYPCPYCGGMGYESYPSYNHPCRIPGHAGRHQKNLESLRSYFAANPEPEPAQKPKVGNWQWTGHGWKNLDYKGI